MDSLLRLWKRRSKKPASRIRWEKPQRAKAHPSTIVWRSRRAFVGYHPDAFARKLYKGNSSKRDSSLLLDDENNPLTLEPDPNGARNLLEELRGTSSSVGRGKHWSNKAHFSELDFASMGIPIWKRNFTIPSKVKGAIPSPSPCLNLWWSIQRLSPDDLLLTNHIEELPWFNWWWSQDPTDSSGVIQCQSYLLYGRKMSKVIRILLNKSAKKVIKSGAMFSDHPNVNWAWIMLVRFWIPKKHQKRQASKPRLPVPSIWSHQ